MSPPTAKKPKYDTCVQLVELEDVPSEDSPRRRKYPTRFQQQQNHQHEHGHHQRQQFQQQQNHQHGHGHHQQQQNYGIRKIMQEITRQRSIPLFTENEPEITDYVKERQNRHRHLHEEEEQQRQKYGKYENILKESAVEIEKRKPTKYNKIRAPEESETQIITRKRSLSLSFKEEEDSPKTTIKKSKIEIKHETGSSNNSSENITVTVKEEEEHGNETINTPKSMPKFKIIEKCVLYDPCECTNEKCLKNCINRSLNIECGDNCPSGIECLNKNFQKGQNPNIELFFAGVKGWGIRATAPIMKRTFISEYIGEIIDEVEFKKRNEKYSKTNAHHYIMALVNGLFIDATKAANISRFYNHSCDPNAESQKWMVNGMLRIGIFAKKDIAVGEEIVYDYDFQTFGEFSQKCFCGTLKCKDLIGKKASQSPEHATGRR